MAAEVVTLGNQERAQARLAPLTFNAALAAAAQGHAEDLGIRGFADAAGENAHVNPEGENPGDRISAQGYDWSARAENVLFGGCTAEGAVQDWVNSELHRQNLMSPTYTETGVGLYQGGEHRMYWVQVFASP